MAFSESFEFGNSTYMKLESQIKRAIVDADVKESEKGLDVIQESPTGPEVRSMRNSSILTSSRIGLRLRRSDGQTSATFRRSKSDSTLPKMAPITGITPSTCSECLSNGFSLTEERGEETSVLRISEIEAAFEECEREERIDNNKGAVRLDVPTGSDDVQGLSIVENNDVMMWEDSLATSSKDFEIPNEALHDVSSFICHMADDQGAAHEMLQEELERSRQVVQTMGSGVKDIVPRNISLSCMSPEQLKWSPSTPTEESRRKDEIEDATDPMIPKSGPFLESANKKESLKKSSAIPSGNLESLRNMSAWNLPPSVLQAYERKGIVKMFEWQVDCLSNPKILFEHCNLVYSAPTSAGKTLVSEILLLKTVLERAKKVLLILPFISIVREKMIYLQDLLTAAGYRVEGFFGGYTPPGGFESIHVAICTIEKANSIVNKLLEQGRLDELGTVIVDEVHLISDPGRGYILELLLAKILYISRKFGLQIQVVTMSATLTNVELLRSWLDAEFFVTDFRPVALREMIKVGDKIYDNKMQFLRNVTASHAEVDAPFAALQNDPDHVAQLCIETLLEGCSVIVFCPSKDWCESLALQLAGAIHFLGKNETEWSRRLRSQISRQAIDGVKRQLRDIPTGLDTVLEKTVTYACAFHHAGLTTEERDIVEASFKAGALKVIVATSTLSSGVNLPARRVLIRTPLFGGKQMSSLTYRQMIGRAGRTGKDTLGESILICTEGNARIGRELITEDLRPISSCLEFDGGTHLKRALLEVISSGVASSGEDIERFVNCTLLSAQKRGQSQNTENNSKEYITTALDFLVEFEFVRLQENEETHRQNYVATRLGMACLASSMPPTDGLILFAELQKSRRCFVLESELHAVYLVTPYSVCYQLQDLDWLLFLDLWEKLSPAMRKVAELVGVKESFLVRAMRGQTKLDYKQMQVHRRFYIALALQELVNETPMNVVALRYKCSRGMLQSLQQVASTFAGIVTAFCNSLQWDTLSLIVSQFKERLYFGVHRDLLDLMRLPDLNHRRARALHDGGITSLVELASADVWRVEKVLFNALSFDSIKRLDNESELEAAKRNTERNVFMTGQAGLTVSAAARLLVHEARQFVAYEIGVKDIDWSQSGAKQQDDEKTDVLHMSCEGKNEADSSLKSKDVKMMQKIGSECKEEDVIHVACGQKSEKESHLVENESELKLPESQCKSCSNKISQVESTEGNATDGPDRKMVGENLITFEDDSKFVKAIDNIVEKDVDKSCKRRESFEEGLRNEDVIPSKVSKEIGATKQCSAVPVTDEEKPGTSKKAQRLLRAKQLSEMKKLEQAKRNYAKAQEEEVSEGNRMKSDGDAGKCEVAKKASVGNDHLLNSNDGNRDFINQNGKTSVNNKQTVDNYKKMATSLSKPNQLREYSESEFKTHNSSEDFQMMTETKSAQVPRRSPRIQQKASDCLVSKSLPQTLTKSSATQSNTSHQMDDLFAGDRDTPASNSVSVREVKGNGEVGKLSTRDSLNKSQEDEIPSSQKLSDNEAARSPFAPRSLRSFRAAQKTQRFESKSTKSMPRNRKEGGSFRSSPELSDLSMENSLIKNPIQLNASHILSCSQLDPGASSFTSIQILNICGDIQLFKETFKELMSAKRVALCVGLEQQTGKRKPLIGANLLINQLAAQLNQLNAEAHTCDFQIDDATYLAGIAFSVNENIVFYMNMQQEGTCKDVTSLLKCKYLRMLLRSPELTLLMYDAKEQLKSLRTAIADIDEISVSLEDPKVANWLLQPDELLGLQHLCQQFAPECIGLVNLCGRGRGCNSFGLDSSSAILAKIRSSIEACVTVHVLRGQIENLERIGRGQLYKFFKELEMPLQLSLCNMEMIGFPTSVEALHKLFQQMVDTMKRLEGRIYELHGSRFNLSSSSAVARVLGLHRNRKPNGRISTSRQVLEKIDSPISQMIIIYRKLCVALTKNIQPLLKCVQDERIHGQSLTFTSTGRISMSEPNLQNVAKDFEVDLGAEKLTISCRSAFFPSDERLCLISSDFCQLEMRILAHLSQDPALLQVMRSERDIFTAIAARWNKVPEHSVSEQLRNGTKQLCYGIVYGMGVRSLAESLKCTELEAKSVSEQFHAAYPGIRSYMEKVVKFARSHGYIETITGRRRYLEHINSGEALVKSQAERQAVNSTIQGSAADIAKSAILRMEKNITKYREKLGIEAQAVRLVLHLHDELIFEVPEEKAKKVAKVLRVTMENCAKLSVPLKVKLKMGRSWGELMELK